MSEHSKPSPDTHQATRRKFEALHMLDNSEAGYEEGQFYVAEDQIQELHTEMERSLEKGENHDDILARRTLSDAELLRGGAAYADGQLFPTSEQVDRLTGEDSIAALGNIGLRSLSYEIDTEITRSIDENEIAIENEANLQRMFHNVLNPYDGIFDSSFTAAYQHAQSNASLLRKITSATPESVEWSRTALIHNDDITIKHTVTNIEGRGVDSSNKNYDIRIDFHIPDLKKNMKHMDRYAEIARDTGQLPIDLPASLEYPSISFVRGKSGSIENVIAGSPFTSEVSESDQMLPEAVRVLATELNVEDAGYDYVSELEYQAIEFSNLHVTPIIKIVGMSSQRNRYGGRTEASSKCVEYRYDKFDNEFKLIGDNELFLPEALNVEDAKKLFESTLGMLPTVDL